MRLACILIAAAFCAAASPARAQEMPTVPLPREGAVVERGDAVVDLDLIDAFLSRIPADKRAGYIDDPERIELMLQRLLLTLQLAHDAEQSGLADDPLVREVLRLQRAEFLARRQLRRALADLPDPDFTQLARERYLAAPNLYTTTEMRDLRHLVVLTRNHGEEGARKRAEELLAAFRAGEQDFEAFVREHSEEPRADQHGGLLAKVPRKNLDTGFAEAAFAIEKKGEVVGPVKSRYGWHLIQLVEVYPAVKRSFDEVKDEIIAQLRAEYRGRKRQEYLDNLKAAAQLKADPEQVAALRTRYLEDGPGAQRLKRYDQLESGAEVDAGLGEDRPAAPEGEDPAAAAALD